MMIFQISPFALVVIFLLDLLVGEPRRFPHPVALMGKAISSFEQLFNRGEYGKKKVLGSVIAIFLPLVTFLLSAFILGLSYKTGNGLGLAMTVLLGFTTIATRGLADAARRVKKALDRGDLPSAREALSHIVGRQTSQLEEGEIVRATVETVAENTSDGIIAPLFYLFLGGVPLAMAYKAVNTLDSMVGYKNDRYRDFGWASARLDDLLNFVPSRLTAVLMVLSAFFLKMDWRGAWRIMERDSGKHPSPNAGWPEAAAAGALGIRLGGENSYPGRSEVRPFIGDKEREMVRDDIDKTMKLLYGVSVLMVVLILFFRGLF